MRNHFRTAFAVAAVVAATSAFACPFCKSRTTGLFIGETQVMGDGIVRAFAEIAEDGSPRAVGATFTETALSGLAMEAKDSHGVAGEFLVRMPSQAEIFGVDHVQIDWAPQGHDPKPIYGKGHFDFHFYTIPTTTRAGIPNEGEKTDVAYKAPAEGQLPPNYIPAPKSQVKYMGAHWVDVTSPELNCKPFTSTFIYGYWDGLPSFYEPMITKETIETRKDFVKDIPTAMSYAADGWHPTKYAMRYDAKRREYTVSLEGWVKHTATK